MITTKALLFTVLLVLSGFSQSNAGQIKLCARTATTYQPISNADVKCWDDDFNTDDFMTSGRTGSDGCVTLTYKDKSTSNWSCWKWWDSCASKHPDIFCEVSGQCLEPESTGTKEDHNQKNLADFGNVYLEENSSFCGDDSWNGCGPHILPDWLTDVADDVSGFRDQCNEHDVCYGICDKSRLQCEQEFKQGMYGECNGDYWCEFLADAFYEAVYNLGEGGCRRSREDNGCTASEINMCDI